MRRKRYHRARNEGWPPQGFARRKDDVSSGPSANDPGLGGFMAGGSGSTSAFDTPNIDASTGFNAAVTPPTGSSAVAASPALPAFSLGTSGSFSASDGSSPFSFGQSGGSGAVPSTSSLSNPAGFTTPAVPAGPSAVSAFGGVPAGPTDLSSYYDPNNPQSSPLAGAPQGGSTDQLSAKQLGQPGGQPAPAGGAPAPAAASGGNSILDSLGIKNPLGAAIGAAGLGYAALQGQKAPKFSPQLQAQADALSAQGKQLMSYLQSGNLPPGLQASLTQATSAAKAKIISNFASQGLNTDPNQNSALAAELAAVDQQALISTAQIGQQLMQTGIQESGLSSDLYKTLANIDQTQTASIGKAIASFASALSGGGGGGINLSLAKA